MERCITAFSDRSTEKYQSYSFDDVYEKLTSDGRTPLLVIFSSDYDNFDHYSGLFHEKFPDAQVIGTTSFTNYCSAGCGRSALSALAVYEGVECESGVLFDVKRCPIRHRSVVEKAYDDICLTGTQGKDICCLEFTTAFGKCEELVLDTFYSVTGRNVPVIGSSAGVREGTERSFVSLNGKVYDEACVFVLIKNLHGRISVIRENTYRPTVHFFTVTSVDSEERRIFELDGRPAAPYLSEIMGIDMHDLIRDLWRHPLGRIYSDNIYITDGEHIGRDGSLSMYSHVYNCTRTILLEPDDVGHVRDRLFGKIADISYDPSFSFAINCAFDFDIFADKGVTKPFLDELKDRIGVFSGVSGCGEQVDMNHVNKTMLIVMFE